MVVVIVVIVDIQILGYSCWFLGTVGYTVGVECVWLLDSEK